MTAPARPDPTSSMRGSARTNRPAEGSTARVRTAFAPHERFWRLIREAAKFGVVGGIAFVVTETGANMLHFGARMGPLASIVIATFVATFVSYAGNRHWAFRHREGSGAGRDYIVYFALNAIGILIQLACEGLAYYALGLTSKLSYNVALASGIGFGTLFRFWSYRKWVWHSENTAPEDHRPSEPGSAARVPATAQLGTVIALLARDLYVLRSQVGQFLVRVVMQPLLLVFVFAYVFPKIGQGFASGSGGSGDFTTILVPGLIAVSINFQGIQSVALPLVQEFGFSKEIEDRVLAPVPVWMVGAGKIATGAIQSIVAAAAVFPIAYLVHARGAAPTVHIHNWSLFILVIVFASLLGSAMGLLIGTVVEPRKINLLFSVIILPITFLGCVYYPWSNLSPIPWLKYFVLANPLVYMSEGLRAALTPQVGHMPTWAFLLALIGGTFLLGALALRKFSDRVVT